LEINLKGLHFADVAEIQEAVTDELKKVKKKKKKEFSAAFKKLYNRAITHIYIYANGAYLKKKGMCSSSAFDF